MPDATPPRRHRGPVAPADPDVARRGANARLILRAVLVLGAVTTVALALVPPDGGPAAIIAGLVTLVTVPSLVLVRRGRVDAGVWLFLVTLLVATAASPAVVGGSRLTPVYLAIPASLATVLLPPRPATGLVGAALGLAVAVTWWAPLGPAVTQVDVLVSAVVLVLASSIAAGLGSLAQVRAMRVAQSERAHAEALTGELRALNEDLEQRVSDRTDALSRALDRQEQLTAELAATGAVDPETGLVGPTTVLADAARAAADARRAGMPWAAVVVHPRRDHPDLGPTAAALSAAIRAGDLVGRGRDGGFVVVMRGAGPDEAAAVAARLGDGSDAAWTVGWASSADRDPPHDDHRDAAADVLERAARRARG